MRTILLYLFRQNALLVMRYSIILVLCFVISIPLYALTENEVYCYIKEMGIKHPQVVLKQAIYESGHFKSNIFKKKKNLFGFRQTKYKNYTNEDADYYHFLQKKNYSGNRNFRYDTQLKRTRITADLNCLMDEKKE